METDDEIGGTTHWKPRFLVLMYFNRALSNRYIDTLRDDIDPYVRNSIRNLVFTGSISIFVILVSIYVISLFLTLPLEWMNKAGKDILEAAGETSNKAEDGSMEFGSRSSVVLPNKNTLEVLPEKKLWYRFSPRTEVIILVEHFHQMVKQFSGNGTAKIFKRKLLEVKNPFMLHQSFQSLYEARFQRKLSVDYQARASESLLSRLSLTSSRQAAGPPQRSSAIMTERLYTGPNVHAIDEAPIDDESGGNSSQLKKEEMWRLRRQVLRSKIFRWMIVAVVVPLVLALGAISYFVLVGVSSTLPSLVEASGEVYAQLERDFLVPHVASRADYISEALSTSLRDLHVHNRIVSWLASGGIVMTTSTMPPLIMDDENCKAYISDDGIPGFCPDLASRMATCDCAWDDPWGTTCSEQGPSSRLNQVLSLDTLREDADSSGNRNNTSYPALATTPNTTQWWPNIESLPGYNTTMRYNQTDTSTTNQMDGTRDLLDTSFDRARIVAAMSAIQIPLYNYVQQSDSDLSRLWSTNTAFEKDGSFSVYAGCYVLDAYSALARGGMPGYDRNKELCPDGKFG